MLLHDQRDGVEMGYLVLGEIPKSSAGTGKVIRRVALIPIRSAPAALPGGRRRAWSAIHCGPAKQFYGTSRRVWCEDPGYIPAPSASTVWRSGIIQSGLSPLPSEEFAVANQWQDVVGGIHVNVFAGASRKDTTQGVLVVMRTSANFVPLGTTMVSVPSHTGALHIESASVSNVLTVQSTSGQSWVFNTEQVSLG